MNGFSDDALIDRESELRALRRLLEAGAARLALLTGRRRVGKTFLLTHAWGSTPFFLFTAARTTGEVNRRQLLHDMTKMALRCSTWVTMTAEGSRGGLAGSSPMYPWGAIMGGFGTGI